MRCRDGGIHRDPVQPGGRSGDDSTRNPRDASYGKKTKAEEVGDQPVNRPQEVPGAYSCDFGMLTTWC